MDKRELAGLKRKYAACLEPSKKAELRHSLVMAGVDPDAAETVSVAPKGRTAPVRVTAAPTTPQVRTDGTAKAGDSSPRAKAAVAPAAPEDKETSKETADKAVVRRRTVGRTRKTETSKENE